MACPQAGNRDTVKLLLQRRLHTCARPIRDTGVGAPASASAVARRSVGDARWSRLCYTVGKYLDLSAALVVLPLHVNGDWVSVKHAASGDPRTSTVKLWHRSR